MTKEEKTVTFKGSGPYQGLSFEIEKDAATNRIILKFDFLQAIKDDPSAVRGLTRRHKQVESLFKELESNMRFTLVEAGSEGHIPTKTESKGEVFLQPVDDLPLDSAMNAVVDKIKSMGADIGSKLGNTQNAAAEILRKYQHRDR